MDNGNGTSTLAPAHYIAKIGETKYESLQEAVNAAGTNAATITLLTEAATDGVISGEGVVVPENSNITFDLNGLTYDVSGETVGSSTTETNGFQLLKNSNITFKNGTLKATAPTAQMLIQNYSNLTLENVNLDGTGLSGWAYALSNNCGTINLTGSTSITAKEGGRAFDTCKFGSYAIPTVNINTTGVISGPIEATGGKLNIENGKFDVTWVTDNNYAAGDIQIKGGEFTAEVPKEYCVEGFVCVDNDNAPYLYTVKSKEEAGIYELIDGEPYKYVDGVANVEKVTYIRNFSSRVEGNYQCWFVPFDYTVGADTPEGVEFFKINQFSASDSESGSTEVADEQAVWMHIVKVANGTVLRANKPYLVRVPAAGKYEFIAENVDLKAKQDERIYNLNSSYYDFDFYGTYVSGVVPAAEAYQWLGMNVNGNLYWNATANKSVASSYRWYIKPSVREDSYARPNIIVVEGDGDTDGINNAQTAEGEIQGIYTLGGIKVEHPVKGVNIIKYTDGRTKKIYVK